MAKTLITRSINVIDLESVATDLSHARQSCCEASQCPLSGKKRASLFEFLAGIAFPVVVTDREINRDHHKSIATILKIGRDD